MHTCFGIGSSKSHVYIYTDTNTHTHTPEKTRQRESTTFRYFFVNMHSTFALIKNNYSTEDTKLSLQAYIYYKEAARSNDKGIGVLLYIIYIFDPKKQNTTSNRLFYLYSVCTGSQCLTSLMSTKPPTTKSSGRKAISEACEILSERFLLRRLGKERQNSCPGTE